MLPTSGRTRVQSAQHALPAHGYLLCCRFRQTHHIHARADYRFKVGKTERRIQRVNAHHGFDILIQWMLQRLIHQQTSGIFLAQRNGIFGRTSPHRRRRRMTCLTWRHWRQDEQHTATWFHSWLHCGSVAPRAAPRPVRELANTFQRAFIIDHHAGLFHAKLSQRFSLPAQSQRQTVVSQCCRFPAECPAARSNPDHHIAGLQRAGQASIFISIGKILVRA